MTDIAHQPARTFVGRRFAPGLLPPDKAEEDLLAPLAALEGERNLGALCDAFAANGVSKEVKKALVKADRVDRLWDVYGRDTAGRPLGLVLSAPKGGKVEPDENSDPADGTHA